MTKKSILQKQYDKLKKKAEEGILSKKDITALGRIEEELAVAGNDILKNAEAAAAYAGCSKRTIWDAVKKGLLIKQPDRSYLRDDIDTWLNALGKSPVKGTGGNNEKQANIFDRPEEEAKYRHWRAKREELIVKRMEAELIPVDEVQRGFVRRANEFKTSLLLLSRSVAHIVAAETGMESKKVAKIIDREVRDLLQQISRPVELEIE